MVRYGILEDDAPALREFDMTQSAAARGSGSFSGRKRKAEAVHSLVEMCLTSSRRAFLSFSWTAKLLRSPKRTRMVGGGVPWSGFNWLQHKYLHHAVLGAAKASSELAGSAAAAKPTREAPKPPGRGDAERNRTGRAVPAAPKQSPDAIDLVDLTLSDDATVTSGRATNPGRASACDASPATASSLPTASSQPPALRTPTSAPTRLTQTTPVGGERCGSRRGGSINGTPAALQVARAGTPRLAVHQALRPRPKPTACVATTPVGPATNLQSLTAGDLGRLLGGTSWLNDEVVNFYMLLIQKRDAESRRRFETAAAAAAAAAAPPATAAAAAVAGPSSHSSAAVGRSGVPLAKSGAARASAVAAAARLPLGPSADGEVGPAAAGQAVREYGGCGPQAEAEGCGQRSLQPVPASPLRQVVTAVAAAVAAGAKHLAQRGKHGQAAAQPPPPAAAAAAGASSVPAAAAVLEISNSVPGSVGTTASLNQQQRQSQPQTHPHHQHQQPLTVFAFNSFFFSKLTDKGSRKCFAYGEVRRWTMPCRTYTADCVLMRDLLLFPINHGNSHWCLAAVWPRRRLLQYFDSLGGSRATADWVMGTLLRWLLTDAEDKGVTHGSVDTAGAAAGAAAEAAAAGWRREWSELRIPQQLDGGSCGVFVCAFAELLARGVPPEAFGFSQTDIPAMRRGMAEQILRGAL
ncbi:hypothetical protein PLESTF_000972800 [Pleodorina starrii]|nr:hypothetical protein PLESTM_000398300 [Pleodorina starrii]GLC70430.1 hypothetical protein PLESTF_000972800 [Pleodorina starrii]